MRELIEALAATAAHHDETGAFPHDGIRRVHEAGLLTVTVAERHGGPAVSPAELAGILRDLGRGDPSVALIASMTQLPHLLQAHRPTWPEALYRRILDESAARPTLLNICRVEPDLGSPSRGGRPATTARRTGEGWSLTGHKRFVTGAEGLAYFLVWAATDEPVPRIGTFVVPAATPGIEIVRTWDPLGLRASGSHDVVFRDVLIPYDHGWDLEGPARPDSAALHLPLAAIYLGVARAAQEYFHRFARERVPANLGRPVATTDRFKAAAGEIETLLSTAEHLLLTSDDPLKARVIVNRHAVAAVTLAVRMLGNPGLSRGNPLERHFRDVQSALVHAPQEDVSLLAIGAAALAE